MWRWHVRSLLPRCCRGKRLALSQLGAPEHRTEKGKVGLQPGDLIDAHCTRSPCKGQLEAISAANDESKQRIIPRGGSVSCMHCCLQADSSSARLTVVHNGALRRSAEIDPCLHCPSQRCWKKATATRLQLSGGEAEALMQARTCSKKELSTDNVHATGLLGDAMLNLQSWIHLDEDVPAHSPVLHLLNEELNSTCIAVASGRRCDEAHRILKDPGTGRAREACGWANLHHLHTPAQLNRAVALEKVCHLPMSIGTDLHLDMAAPLKQLLHEDAACAEGTDGLGVRTMEGCQEVVAREIGRKSSHTTPSSAMSCL
mmetsp:Transcript_54344/g.158647  ORF Transcript_54344/g.158647 Transcript_54344/m.158647 type:complete len:315 (-) Transcript_54344:72-1016(-)